MDGKEVDKFFFYVDHETNVPTEISRGRKLTPYKPYAERGGILKRPKFADNSHSDRSLQSDIKFSQYNNSQFPETSTKSVQYIGKKRYFIMDTGASYNMIHESDLAIGERRAIHEGPSTSITTANGTILLNRCTKVKVEELKSTLLMYVVSKDRPWWPPLLSIGTLCIHEGFRYV